MEGYVWRVPMLFGVMACSAMVLFAAGVAGSVIVRRRPSRIYKAGTGAVLALLVILAAVAVRATATLVARSLDISVTYVDPGPVGHLAPVVFAAFAFAVGKRTLKGAWASGRALLFYTWLLAFTALNVINWCSPGWCLTIGFPFPWKQWSDEIMTSDLDWFFNFVGEVVKVIGAALDLLTFVAVGRVLTHERQGRALTDR